jgi:hypothetical protein
VLIIQQFFAVFSTQAVLQGKKKTEIGIEEKK